MNILLSGGGRQWKCNKEPRKLPGKIFYFMLDLETHFDHHTVHVGTVDVMKTNQEGSDYVRYS